MITIRQGIFETNSSSSDYYREPDKSTESEIEIELDAQIIFNNTEQSLKILKFIDDEFCDILEHTLEDFLPLRVKKCYIKDDKVLFTYSAYLIITHIWHKSNKWNEKEIGRHIPFQSEEFKDINYYKNNILSEIEESLYNFIDYYGNEYNENISKFTDKNTFDIILEIYNNKNLKDILQVIDIYSDDIDVDEILRYYCD